MDLRNTLAVATILLLCLYKTDGWRRRRRRRCVYCRVAWGGWSACSATCGTSGTQTRRGRVTQWPSCGSCPSLVQRVACNRRCCPVPCSYSWGAWSPCRGCGWSTQSRKMAIRRQPICGGRVCPSQRSQSQRCNTGVCCPVNCRVGLWGNWGACNARCGQKGNRTRTRSVTTRPSCNGVACPSLSERATCMGPCCPVNCVVSSWGSWSRCNAPTGQCGTNSGTITRRRVIQKQNSCNGTSCPQLSESARCTPVKITCQVSSWGSWSACSPSNGKCGAGTRTRRRTIVRQPYCSGACLALSETGRCTHSCCPVNCVVGPWSGWSVCSKTCGAGRKTRSRKVTIKSSCNGRSCPTLLDSTSCTRYINRNCVMNGWSSWSACSTGCGKGRTTRTRSVRTTPLCRGRPCPATVEAKDCYSYRENRDCAVSAWSSWGACSEKCAVGTRQRTRTVGVTQQCQGRACPALRDSSQCGVANNGCQHVCTNGACACNAGYYLAPDKKKCYAKNCGTASPKYCASGTSLGTTCKYANVSCPGGSTLFPVTCSLGCPQFYSIRGASTITCQSSGKWTSYSASYCRRNNDPPTGITMSGSSIAENRPRDSRVGSFSSSDPNTKDRHTYRLILVPGGSFEIRGNTLYTLRVFNYETSQKRFSIVVRSTDNGRPAMHLDKTFTIGVTDVNETPTAIQISASFVSENSAGDTTVGVLSTVDPDSGQTHTYTLLDSAGGRFKLQGRTLKVAQSNANCLAQGGSVCLLNYENQKYHNIRVSSVDSGSPRKSVTQTLRIAVVDTNDQPRDLSLSNNTVKENAPLNFVIGTFTATDEDTGQRLAFSLADSDNGRFKIDSHGRILKGKSTDYETNKVHYVTATVKDNGSPSMSMSKRFTIEVLNVNEPPVSITLSTAVVQENGSRGTTVGTLTAVDRDAVQTLTFKMDDSAGGKFALDRSQTCTNSTSGGTQCQVRLQVNGTLNFEQAHSHSVTVRVTDDKGLFRTQRFNVRVTDVNDAPTDITVSGSSTAQVNENTKDAAIGDLKTADEDSNQTHSYTLSLNGGGNFEVRGNKLYVSKNASLNYENVKSYSIVVRSTDSGWPSKYVDKSITINIGDVNERPTAITLSNNTIAENTPPGTMIGSMSITDPDVRQTHTCSLLNSAGGRLGIINSGSIQLTVGSAGVNYEDIANVTISVRCVDQGGLAFDKAFVIQVDDVNEAPAAIRLSSGNVRENRRASTQVGTLTTVDPDNIKSQKQSFVYSLVSSSVSLPFKVNKNAILTTRRLDYENVPQWNIQVKVQDSGTPVKYFTQSFTIQVQDANDPPDGIVLSNSVVEENSQGGAVVGVFTARDQDNAQKHMFRLVDSAGGKFSIQGSTLQVGLVNANCLSKGGSSCDLNYENQRQYVVTAEVQDNGAPPMTYRKNFTIVLRDVNDRPRNLQLSNNRVPENAPLNTFIGRLTATDEDTRQALSFSLTDDDGGRFSVDSVGRLYKAKPTNYETQKRHVIRANVTDNGSPTLSIEQSFIIEVLNVNESPFNMTFTSQGGQMQFPTNAPRVKENSTVNTAVGTVIVFDQDAKQSVRWSLDDGGNGAFNYSTGPCTQVSNVSGYRTKCTATVIVIGVLDYERRADYSVAVKALDNGGRSVEQQFKISVVDVNEAPSNITLSGNQVNENSNGALVGELGTIDQDSAQTHTYRLVDDAAGKFVVRANKIYVSSSAYLDFEAQSSYAVIVKATDSGTPSLSVQKQFTIRVTNVNEAPTNITISNSHVRENSQSGTVIGRLNVSDPDKGQTHTCRINGNQIGQFVIHGGQLVVGNVILNFEQTPSISVGVSCTDFGLPPSLSLQKFLTIKVDDVNEAPTALSLSSNTITENQPPSIVGTFDTSDPDNENQAVERQKFTYTITTSTAGLPFVIDGDALNTTRSLDFETTPSWNITVKSQDSGNPPLSILATFQINVIDVNEPPFNIRISNSRVDENSNQDVVVGSLTCQDPDVAQTHTFALVDGALGRFKLSNGRIKTAIPNTACLNMGGNNCKLNYEKQSDYVIRLRSTDNGLPPQSTETNLTIQLNDVNDRPRDLKLSNHNVKENATVNTLIGKLSARDEDKGQVLSFSLVDDDSGRFRVDSTGNLYKSKSSDYETSKKHTIVAQVKDNGTRPMELNKTLTIVVENVNEAPVNITFTSEGGQQTFPDNSPAINENSPSGTPVGTLMSLDHDAVQTLLFTLDEDANGRFSIEPNVTCHNNTNIPGVKTICSTVLRVSGALDSEESTKEDIIVRVTDNSGLFHTQLFTVRILDVNDRPTNITLAGGDIGYIDENMNNALVGELVTSDEDVTQSHTYRLVNNGGLRFRIVGDRVYTSSGANLNYEKKSTYTIVVRTIDSGTPSLHLDKTFVIQVLDVNERPTDIILSGSSVNENSAHGTKVGNLSVLDPDNNGPRGSWQLHYCLMMNSANTEFIVNSTNHNVLVAGDLNFEKSASYDVTISCYDNGVPQLSFAKMFTLAILDVNERPTRISLSNNVVGENSGIVSIGRLTTADPDNVKTVVQSFTYTLVNRAHNSLPFVIDGDVLNTTKSLDYEIKSTWMVTVKSTDNKGLSLMMNFSIAVTDSNDAPTGIVVSGPQKLSEDSPVATYIATLVTTDQDARQTHTYSIIEVAASDHYGSSTASNHGNLTTQFSVESPSGLVTLSRADLNYEKYCNYTISVNSTDSGFPPYSVTGSFVVMVTDVHERPTDVILTNNKIRENSPAGTVVGSFSVYDPDNSNVQWQSHLCVITNSIAVPFKVVNQTTLVVAKDELNYENKSLYLLNVTCSEMLDTNFSISRTFFVNVLDVNEPPFNLSISNNTVLENQQAGAQVGSLRASDPDMLNSGTANITFSIVSQVPNTGMFSLSNRRLVTTALLDYERQRTYNLTIVARDSGSPPLSTRLFLAVKVLDDNDAPSLVVLNHSQIYENSANGSLVGFLETVDQDSGQTHSYTLVDRQDTFIINGRELLAKPLDYEVESRVNVTVRTTDDGLPPRSTETVLMVTILDLNDPPSGIEVESPYKSYDNVSTASVITIEENSPSNMSLANLTVDDQDLDQQHTWTLLNGSEFFHIQPIDSNSSMLLVKQGAILDYEKHRDELIKVMIQCTDAGNPPYSVSIIQYVALTDVNEAPTNFSYSGQLTVMENSKYGAVIVGRFSCQRWDPEENECIFEVVGKYAEVFKVNKNRSLEVINSTWLDYEAITPPAILDVTINATDTGLPPPRWLSRDTHISVLDTNEPPSDIRLEQSSVLENVSIGYCLEITCDNPEPYQRINFALLSTYNGTFELQDHCENSTRGRNSVFLIVAANLSYDLTNNYEFRVALDDGYDGKLVELVSLNITRVDPCPHVTECHVNATCNRINGREHACVCKFGYTGDGYQNCTNIDECLPNPCKFSGICTDRLHNYTCDCPTGYQTSYSFLHLPHCQDTPEGGCESFLPQCEEINDCDPNPCNNSVWCADALNNYTCFCAAGFKGRNCSINIDECEPHSCGAQGDCTDGINSFTCQCNEGYMGTQCQRLKEDCHPDPCVDPDEEVCVRPDIRYGSKPPLCISKSFTIMLQFSPNDFTTSQVASPAWKYKLQNFFESDLVIPVSEMTLDASENNTVQVSDVIFVETGAIDDSDNREYTEVKFVAKTTESARSIFKLDSAFIPRNGFFRALNRTCQFIPEDELFEFHICQAIFARIRQLGIPSQQTFGPDTRAIAQKDHRSTGNPSLYYVGGALCGLFLIVLIVAVALSGRNAIQTKQRRHLKHEKFVSKGSDELFTDVLQRHQLAQKADDHDFGNINPMYGVDEEEVLATIHMQDNPLYQSPMQDSNLPEEMQVAVEFSNPMYQSFKEIDGQAGQSEC